VDVPITEVIAGKYRLLRKLGQGGMGSVWYAEHMTLHSPVAIKLIDPSIADNAEALGRFLREAQSAASLRSPHVVQILDHGVDNGVPYIAMELLDGESLADRLTRVGRLSPGETARVLQHVARAIGRAHEAGIVHRDLKPDNIYLVRNDDEEIAKVLDFGIAKSNAHGLSASAGGGTRTGAVLGTPYYMSPEQAEGAKTLDGRADIWAMGVIAFECLLGSRPFDEETLGSLLLAICARPIPIPSQRGPVPPGFDEWFARACARDVTQRYAVARDAAADLRQVCDGTRGTSGNYGPPPNASGSQTPAPHFGSGNLPVAAPNSGAVSGQSVPGFASTQVEQPAGVPAKSGGGLALVLAAVAILVVAGGVLAWTRLSGGPSAAASASASSTPTAPLVASAPAPSITPTPAPVASVSAPIPEPALTVATAAGKAGGSHPVPQARPHAVPAVHSPPAAARPAAVAPPVPAAPAAPAPAAPKPADNRVNLGI
jgi:serine/threonine-protein kinase